MFPPKKKPLGGASEMDVVGGLMAEDAAPADDEAEEMEEGSSADPEMLVNELQSKLAELKASLSKI